ncbi:hypothetical protein AnigIFM63326_001914 [Aspergillus niger]|nr:hypothetical protein AnigIFM63326_001914 [Aspergillus niger]
MRTRRQYVSTPIASESARLREYLDRVMLEMEETGHIDWLYGVGKPETATCAPVVVAGKEVERSVRETRVRLETKVLQKYGSLILQDQVQFTDQEVWKETASSNY